MSANPRVIAVDTTIFWDGAPQRLSRGTVLDVAPDSALLAAIGTDRLVPLRGASTALQVNSVEPAEPVEPAPAPAKARAAARKNSDAKDGAS